MQLGGEEKERGREKKKEKTKTVKPPAVFLAHLDMFVFNHANSLIAINQIE